MAVPAGLPAGAHGLVLLVLGLISGALAAVVADSKARSGPLWFLLGLVFGPLGLIAAAGISDRKNHMFLSMIARSAGTLEGELERIELEGS